ncbi:MAG: phosphatidate cytidylyltransferase [Clostridiales bacterium]|jgi:phosphatidate cytidylyltransferase|nr:phosphatidate cytidylyltransferase [Clostridiales bacterium]
MKTRIITGSIIFSIYVVFITLTAFIADPIGRLFYDAMVIAMMIIGGIEMSNAISKRYGKPIVAFIVLNCLLGYAVFKVVHHTSFWGGVENGGIFAFFGQLFVIFLLCIIYNMFKKRDISNVFSTIFVLVYPVSLMVYILSLNYLMDSLRIMAILLVFMISSFTDVFAYFVGSIVKGPKLAPNISPKKTVSGAIGGLMGGLLASLLVFMFGQFGIMKVELFTNDATINMYHLTIIGVLGAAFNQLGDLVASFIKRACGAKDFSSLLPGHGGVVDRVDGMMLVAVFVFLYISAFDMMSKSIV